MIEEIVPIIINEQILPVIIDKMVPTYDWRNNASQNWRKHSTLFLLKSVTCTNIHNQIHIIEEIVPLIIEKIVLLITDEKVPLIIEEIVPITFEEIVLIALSGEVLIITYLDY